MSTVYSNIFFSGPNKNENSMKIPLFCLFVCLFVCLFLEFGAELASEGSADVSGRLIQRHEDGVVGGDTYREFGEIHADVVSVRQRHLDVIDL